MSPYKSYEVQEIQCISRHSSPILDTADENAIPIVTPAVIPSLPRIPTPTLIPPSVSPTSAESPHVVTLEKARRGIFLLFKNLFLKINFHFM